MFDNALLTRDLYQKVKVYLQILMKMVTIMITDFILNTSVCRISVL